MASNTYSPEFLADLERTMSRARLSRYMRAANGDLPAALGLYEKNVALSESLFGFLHGLEVAIRNSMHHVLSQDLGQPDWYQDGLALPWHTAPQLNFTRLMNGIVHEARTRAGAGAPIGKVIAELKFAFWSNMLASRFDPIWRSSLYKAFPNGRPLRSDVHLRLEVIRWLRNRIAHHEPILTSRNEVYTGFTTHPTITMPQLLQCVEWVSPATAQWLVATTRYNQAAVILADCHRSGITL